MTDFIICAVLFSIAFLFGIRLNPLENLFIYLAFYFFLMVICLTPFYKEGGYLRQYFIVSMAISPILGGILGFCLKNVR